MATVNDILAVMDRIAPPENAESWDNPGLLVGRADAEVRGIRVCLDVTAAEVAAAKAEGANLLISHHPLMFRAVKQLRDDTPEGHVLCELIRNDMNMIAAHTNLDSAAGGVNDCLAEICGITQVENVAPYLRVGSLCGTFGTLANEIERQLSARVLTYGALTTPITRAAVCSGAGGSFAREAAEAGAQLFITGEMKHSEIIEARQLGLAVIIAGHFETERVVLSHLATTLQNALDALQYKAYVHISELDPRD